MSATRVLIADDHPLIVIGITTALTAHGIDVVRQVNAAEDVASSYEETKPDVVVLDIRFNSSVNGLDVARELLQRHPDAVIVFYSQFDQDETISEAYALGAKSFIPKNTPPELLAEAIRHVQGGQPYFLKEIAERLALLGVRGDVSIERRLEPRELEVFKLLAQGLTANEIAEKLDISIRTVSAVTQVIKRKLKVERQAEITLLAVKHMMILP